MKQCVKCEIVKTEDEFGKDSSYKSGRSNTCRTCRNTEKRLWRARKGRAHFAMSERDQKLRRRYGITLNDYDELLKEQNGGCAVCGDPPGTRSRGNHFHVDHCHESGAVRGLLCGPCNTALGQLLECSTRASSLLSYILKHSR